MSEREANEETDGEGGSGGVEEDAWEWWVRSALVLGGVAVIGWLIVFLPTGDLTLYTQIFGLPALGAMTLPIAVWGMMRTAFNPPVFRISRVVGFGVLLVIGFFSNVPIFAVRLSNADWESDHSYRLPFDGEWRTLAGGADVERNYHATTAAYRWGYDFAPFKEGERYAGEGEELSDYYCFGEPVLAPAPGEVLVRKDGNKDFPPRDFDQTSVLGNHVVLKVNRGEYLFLAHLKKGSIPVEAGAEVERGAKLGECGNSGRAVEPHLHVHLQDRLSFPVARSLPLRFSDYVADGEPVDRGMPVGQGEGGEPAGADVRQRTP